MTLFRWRIMSCLLILIFEPLPGFTKRGGYMNFQFLCYQNPDHLDNQGYECDKIPSINCDPYFLICISNQPIRGDSQTNCPVYHAETTSFDNQESVCNVPLDNRGILKTIPDIELPFPLQETYYVKIIVKDSDQFQNHQTIATFVTSFSGRASPNFNKFVNNKIFMRREENRVRNPRARLFISMSLKCDWNLYGDHCMTFCRATPTDSYVCNDQGMKICKEGLTGPQCVKKDVCEGVRCAKGATCINVDGVPKCSCNGVIGPQCYPGYDPCTPNPCQNGGLCRRPLPCKCPIPYHGSICQSKLDLCQIEPCRNNGTCIILRDGRRMCVCQANYRGPRCEHLIIITSTPSRADSLAIYVNTSSRIIEKKGVNFGILFGCLFGCCLLILSIVGIFFLVRSRRDHSLLTNKQNPVYLTRQSVNGQSRCTSNEYGKCSDEEVYDIIDDRATYDYQIKYNDDYLVPSRPTTPTASCEHIAMSEDQYDLRPDKITGDNTRDNEYFPSLPTRTPKKNPLHQFFNFKL